MEEMEERHPLDLPNEIWSKMSEETKELARAAEVSSKKIEALENHILAECDRQGFTVGEVDCLIRNLSGSLADRRRRVDYEPFHIG